MEEKKFERRSEYAGRNEYQSGYSAEGRKLRPRKNSGPAASSTSSGEYRSYDHHASRPSGQYREGGRYSSQSRPSYGQNRNGANGHEEGQNRPYSQNRPAYGQRRNNYGNNNGGGRYGNNEGRYGNSEGRYSNNDGRYGNSEGRYGNGGYGDREHRPDSRNRSSYGQGRSYNGGAGNGERKPYSQNRPGGAHRNFGGKQGFNGGYGQQQNRAGGHKYGNKRNDFHFTETDKEGINLMLSRQPQIDNAAYSDNDTVATPIQEEVRLNKYIANSGVCSRREADSFIQAGVVTVNGVVVTELGTKVNVLKDDVRFNGEKLKGEEKVYIVMNKPKGYVTSASDPHAEKTVMDLLHDTEVRVFPVGRLDKNTTGVLMFTNDGEIAEKLTHPSYNKKKIYQVILDKPLSEEDKEKILTDGLDLNDGNIKADELEYIDAHDHRRLGIEIHSGKNRIVRRIFESLGYDVKALDRVYFAGVTKKGLKKGEWRYLSEGEVNVLKMGAYV
ncbi:MAG: pseudouridine synthase [Candidatus Cryptobacteroides sp.]